MHRTAFPGTARQGRCGAVQVSNRITTEIATLTLRSGLLAMTLKKAAG